MKKLILGLVAAVALAAPPPPAADVLKEAQARAAAEKKPVLLIFHASWCGWCKKMDAWLSGPEVAPIAAKHFVLAHLTVLERAEKKELENPGAEALYNQLQGKNAGLPYFAFLDAAGKPIVNSRMPVAGKAETANTGFPSEPEEIAWFLTMAKKALPGITADELKTLERTLQPVKK